MQMSFSTKNPKIAKMHQNNSTSENVETGHFLFEPLKLRYLSQTSDRYLVKLQVKQHFSHQRVLFCLRHLAIYSSKLQSRGGCF